MKEIEPTQKVSYKEHEALLKDYKELGERHIKLLQDHGIVLSKYHELVETMNGENYE